MKVRRRRSARWIPAVLIAAVGLFLLFPQTRNRPLSLLEAPFVWTALVVVEPRSMPMKVFMVNAPRQHASA